MNDYATSETIRWIALIPLLAALLQVLLLVVFRRSVSRGVVVATSCGASLLSFVLTCVAFSELIGSQKSMLVDRVHTWLGIGLGKASFTADLALQFDALSAVATLLVTGVGGIMHVYAVGYMGTDPHDDGGHQRFFCYLDLFLFSMLVMVLADNLLLFFLGWEGVALCSYLMVGFWFSEPLHAAAADRAFVIERIGSAGALVGLVLLFWSLAASGEPSVAFRDLELHAARITGAVLALPEWLGGGVVMLTSVVAACFLLAACARSAQGPLLVWLPEATAAPLPAAAFVHGSIGVAGGVYLLCRVWFLYAPSGELSAAIAWLGAGTALLAATVAAAQTDIKKTLAYVTASQLGLMFVALGCGAYAAAIFHTVTYAFSSCLLFLGTGTVIRAMDFEQDMRKMGGLGSKLVRVHLLTAVGVAAVAGFPFLSGFFSRNEILLAAQSADALPGSAALYALGLLTSAMVAFALSRMLFLVFYGQSRLPARVRGSMEDPEGWLIIPLYALAGFALLGGLVGLPQYWGDKLDVMDSNSLANFMASSFGPAAGDASALRAEGWLVTQVLVATLLGFVAALQLYVVRPALAPRLYARFGRLQRLVNANFRLPGAIERTIERPLLRFSDRVLFRFVERRVMIDWIADGPRRVLRNGLSRVPSHSRGGRTQAYLFTMLAGTIVLLGYFVF